MGFMDKFKKKEAGESAGSEQPKKPRYEDLTPEQRLELAAKPGKDAMIMHKYYGGKIETVPKACIRNFDDFSIWYSPGVAEPCKDIEKNQCVIVRRDNREKLFVSLDELDTAVADALQAVHDNMYRKALENMKAKTHTALNFDEFVETAKERPGFIKAMWCGDVECEDKIKDVTGGVKSRCIPFEEEHLSDVCVCCGKPAKHQVFWGKQY